MTKNVLCLVVLNTLLLAGCGESVAWVDQPRQSAKCNEEELEAAKKLVEMSSSFGKNICKSSGKGEFTGELRCQGESLQAACKAE
jgi:hypothetical protein